MSLAPGWCDFGLGVGGAIFWANNRNTLEHWSLVLIGCKNRFAKPIPFEVQHSFAAPWTQPFATLIISVVVINQLIGPADGLRIGSFERCADDLAEI